MDPALSSSKRSGGGTKAQTHVSILSSCRNLCPIYLQVERAANLDSMRIVEWAQAVQRAGQKATLRERPLVAQSGHSLISQSPLNANSGSRRLTS
jgi:hypothetical protein